MLPPGASGVCRAIPVRGGPKPLDVRQITFDGPLDHGGRYVLAWVVSLGCGDGHGHSGRLGQFDLGVLPVVDRRDVTRILGQVTLEDLLEAYRNASA